jgi:probable F420-dependent oxidoreductase
VKIDALLGPLESAATTAAVAEAGGYDGLFSGEVTGDPFLPLVLAADATEHIDIGTSIAVALARSPMALAYTAWDLQRFSGGRMVLGLGSQVKAHVTRRYSMPWGQPVEQMRDFVLAMRAVWDSWSTGAPLDIHSEHYTHTLMPPTFVPTRHDHGAPTVLLAGVGEAMTTMAGEVADGFLCHAFTTDRWLAERTIPALQAGRARGGKTLDGFTVKATIYLATGSDEQIAGAIEEIRGHLAFYASTPQYKPLLDLHGWGDLGAELTTLSKTGRWAEMPALISPDMVDAFALVGAPADIPALVRGRCAGVIDRVSFLGSPTTPELLDSLRDRPKE